MIKKIIFFQKDKHKIISDINNSEDNFIIIFKEKDTNSLKELSENLILKKHKRSVVIVYPFISEKENETFDLNIVPTENEAQDFIEMEDIERILNLS